MLSSAKIFLPFPLSVITRAWALYYIGFSAWSLKPNEREFSLSFSFFPSFFSLSKPYSVPGISIYQLFSYLRPKVKVVSVKKKKLQLSSQVKLAGTSQKESEGLSLCVLMCVSVCASLVWCGGGGEEGRREGGKGRRGTNEVFERTTRQSL